MYEDLLFEMVAIICLQTITDREEMEARSEIVENERERAR